LILMVLLFSNKRGAKKTDEDLYDYSNGK